MSFHYLARGIIRSEGHILLVRAIGDTMTFLPGGHIEFAEPAASALARELWEEASIEVTVGRFVGAAENEWFDHGVTQSEINLIFEVNTSLTHSQPITSNESHLEFFWVRCEDIEQWNLYPEALRALVKQERLPQQAFWGSGVSGENTVSC
ncbi:NUDIX domain-containing protein [Photobacterium ganghwense]|uniref:NUDIX domain-containing protein n=1 Tax=Photobacterium ganghwense TaxID=320778 RepID=UPI0040572FD8